MTALPKVHPAYAETANMPVPDNDREAVVTLLGSGLPVAYLEDAEPSPLMQKASNLWQRLIFLTRFSIMLALLGGYPLMVVLSHKVNSAPITLAAEAAWTSPQAGTALTLIGREVTGPGWAVDRAFWHPQARLNALPAWQEGLGSALSDYMLLTAQNVTPVELAPDADLMAAGRLLAPASDTETGARMHAAAEALLRYEGRLSRGLAAAPAGLESLNQELDLFIAWAADNQETLRTQAEMADGWPASRADIEAVYVARAHAQAAAELLNATLLAQPELVATRDAAEARDAALKAWRRAAEFNPLMISNPAGGTAGLLSDHPATLAWYMAEAETATQTFKAALTAPAPEAELVASVTP